jgi:hypothetical protein
LRRAAAGRSDPLPPSLVPFLPPRQAASQDALARKAIFHPDALRRLSLTVKVLQYAVPRDTLSLFARYQLFDKRLAGAEKATVEASLIF